MVEPELGGNGKWLPTSNPLGGRQENLFFHADVAKQSRSKLIIESLINMIRISHSRLQQSFQPPVVSHKKICDRSCLFVLMWPHPLPPTMSYLSLL
jgi:hypothetical protein